MRTAKPQSVERWAKNKILWGLRHREQANESKNEKERAVDDDDDHDDGDEEGCQKDNSNKYFVHVNLSRYASYAHWSNSAFCIYFFSSVLLLLFESVSQEPMGHICIWYMHIGAVGDADGDGGTIFR